MSTTYTPTRSAHTTESTGRFSSALKEFWNAYQEWRQQERLRLEFSNLSDRELKDIGIARGEIDYAASHRDSDPRGIRSDG
ncbi:DUF1127 domain-containing protein [Bradyrhizobium sp. McL0616]|uniref:DUF1127 domain-containing protein n=1 Tax=Bradyrhizobium sp. McL0616 TaxID=3415674 RepID=UPI003CED8B6C